MNKRYQQRASVPLPSQTRSATVQFKDKDGNVGRTYGPLM